MLHHEVLTEITPEIPLKRLEMLRPTFEKARQSIEKLVLLARQLQPESERGDWGEWYYNAVAGSGTLYVPFGKDGIATVSLFEWDHRVFRSKFYCASATWVGRPNPSYEYRFALLCDSVTGGEFSTPEQDSTDRGFVFYQEIPGGALQVEQFGSNAGGWYEPQITPPNDAIIKIGTMKTPALLDRTIYARLQHKRDAQIMHLD